MRQIDCRLYYHYNGGHPWRRPCLTQLIDGRNFGRKREKAGCCRLGGRGERGEERARVGRREKDGKKARESKRGTEKQDKGSAVAPTGLLVSNVIYLPCTRIKNLHYCATMLRRRALLPNRDLQLGIAANPWRRMARDYGHNVFFLSPCLPVLPVRLRHRPPAGSR